MHAHFWMQRCLNKTHLLWSHFSHLSMCWLPQQLTNSEKNTFIGRKWAKLSPKMQPVDYTSTGTLPALKIEHAASGNESWHCKLASWPVLPNLAVDTIDAAWWAAIRLILRRAVSWKVGTEKLDKSCLLFLNMWSCLTEDIHELNLYTDRSELFCHVWLLYSLITSYINKPWLFSSLLHTAL